MSHSFVLCLRICHFSPLLLIFSLLLQGQAGSKVNFFQICRCVQGTVNILVTNTYRGYPSTLESTESHYTKIDCQTWGVASSYTLAMQTDCNLVMYITAATVDGQVVTSAQLTTVTNTNTVTCGTTGLCISEWAPATTMTTTTAFPYPVWATNTTSTSGLCNLYLSNAGVLTVNNTYAETVWSIGVPQSYHVNQIYCHENGGWSPDQPITCPSGEFEGRCGLWSVSVECLYQENHAAGCPFLARGPVMNLIL